MLCIPSDKNVAAYYSQCTEEIVHDVFMIIFRFFIVDQFHETATLPQVCRSWKVIVGNSYLWKYIFWSLGLPLPSSMKHAQYPDNIAYAQRALAYEINPLLLNKIRGCSLPLEQIFDIGVDFSKYPNVIFFEDTYVVAHDGYEICICYLGKEAHFTIMTSPSKIMSFCVAEEVLYCALETKQIMSAPLNASQFAKFVTLDPCAEENDFAKGCILLFADDKYLIHISNCIKIWDKKTGLLKRVMPVHSAMKQFQLNCNNLYWTCANSNKISILYCCDLNNYKISNHELMSEVRILHNIHVHRKICTFIMGFAVKKNSSGSRIIEAPCIGTLNLFTGVITHHKLQRVGGDINSKLLSFNDLAIYSRSTFELYFPFAINRHEILDFIDYKNGEVVRSFQDFGIHNFGESMTVFQNTLVLVLQNNRILKIKFT